ncbi:MAG: hypothetical protein JWM05_2424 [Acidimicrobiales bacterium]|nr:hypothetical protein [Acidimicrobiales bacterium]
MTDTTGVSRRSSLRWWREVLIAAAFYLVYSIVRNLFGSGGVGQRSIAFRHARSVIHLERVTGLFFEPALQRWYLDLPSDGYIRFWNIYYGTLHFVVTIGVLVFAFRRIPDRYRFFRTTLAATTAVALIGFATFSLMPPRLLDDTSAFGACVGRTEGCHGYGMQDTIAVHGGLWEFGKGAMSSVSNQYAAMPSMHFGWSTWSAITLLACLRKNRWRWLVLLYPAGTLFCILVTANHYWIDAVGGVVALGVGAAIALAIERIRQPAGAARGRPAAAVSGVPAP